MNRAIVLAALAVATPAVAHDGASHGPSWTFDPLITLPLLTGLVIHAVGTTRLSGRSRRGRSGFAKGAAVFAAGWLTLAGALVSPLHEAGERSFTMHMIEHEILMLVAALVLVLARPGPVLLWGLPRALRQAAGAAAGWSGWHRLSEPLTATALQALVIWFWHTPELFDLALRHDGWHIAQHLSFIASGILFWWAMVHRSDAMLAALCLFATSMIGGALGALMTLSASPWYSAYAAMGMTPEGLSPLEDQQLAGLIMWIPGGLFHLCAALWFLGRSLAGKEQGHAVASE